jgi:hypothetical protein
LLLAMCCPALHVRLWVHFRLKPVGAMRDNDRQ